MVNFSREFFLKIELSTEVDEKTANSHKRPTQLSTEVAPKLIKTSKIWYNFYR